MEMQYIETFLLPFKAVQIGRKWKVRPHYKQFPGRRGAKLVEKVEECLERYQIRRRVGRLVGTSGGLLFCPLMGKKCVGQVFWPDIN